MPKITKQTSTGPEATTPRLMRRDPTAGILSRIQEVAEVAKQGGIKLNVYGRGKTGKTRLACTFPKPLLLIGTEDGTKSVANVPGVYFIRINSSMDLEELTNAVKDGSSGYQTVVLDTAGGLQDIVTREVLGLAEMPMQRSWGMANQQDWGVIGSQWKERMSKILDIADSGGVNIVVIAHERNFGDDNNSSLMMPSVGSALSPKTAAWLNASCDYICQAFIREKEEVQTVTVDGVETKMVTRTGKAEYCLRVGPHAVYQTGFRLPYGVVLPDAIVDPTYDKIHRLIMGE